MADSAVLTDRPILTRQSILRIVLDLLAAEIGTSRARSYLELSAANWNEATRLDAVGLDLDSLERLNASAALSEFFHLHEYGAEDYLLSLSRIGEWCELVKQSLAETGTHLTFRTSGSTGVPKRCTHAIADLMVEVEAWVKLLGPVSRVVSLVPAHHIYGTIFTALLPDRLEAACISGQPGGASVVARAAPNTVVVGTPTTWAYLARSLRTFPPGLTGISSTAPLPIQSAHQLGGQGLARLIEIYGSSETGGIGYRSYPADSFALLDHWRRDGKGLLSRQTGAGERHAHVMMDAATWIDERRFTIAHRYDGAVQIGGYNVFPERIRQRLLDHEGVADAVVRLDTSTGRLKAYVIPAPGVHVTGFADELNAWCADLPSVERPRAITIGGALPRTSMGKLADW